VTATPQKDPPPPRSAFVLTQPMMYGVVLSLAILSAASLAAIAYSANAPLIRATFKLTEVEVGAIASCIYIGAAASSIVSGRLTDSLGSGAVLAMSMLALALGCAISAMAPLAAIFFGGLIVAGLGYGAVNPPTNVLANPDSPRHRGLSMSIKQSGIPLGGILAGILVPTVATTTGWRWSMLIPIGACIALAIISSRLRRVRPRDDKEGGGSPARVQIRLPHAYMFGFFMAGIQVAIFIFLALYLVDARGFGAGRAGSALALLLVGGLVGRPAWGWVSDRLHNERVRVLQMAAFLSAMFLVMLPLVDDSVLLVVLLGIGLCSVGWNGVYLAMVTEAVPPRLIGSSTGMALLLVNLGAVVLPPVVGLIVTRAGNWSISWSLCALMSLLSMGILQVARIGAGIRPLEEGRSNAV
jgi:MFS family permease